MTPKNGMPPIHPGEILREEFLVPMGISARQLALALRIPTNRITAIVNETRAVTGETALLLARYFGTSAELWMNLQQSYDLKVAQKALGKARLAKVKPHPRMTKSESAAE